MGRKICREKESEMQNQRLYESVGEYIDKYYVDKPEDIRSDKEVKSIFDRISKFRKKKTGAQYDFEKDEDIELYDCVFDTGCKP